MKILSKDSFNLLAHKRSTKNRFKRVLARVPVDKAISFTTKEWPYKSSPHAYLRNVIKGANWKVKKVNSRVYAALRIK